MAEVTAPALVLGSTQSAGDADPDRAVKDGYDIVRRRSGGGAVWLAPGAQLWVDVWVPAGATVTAVKEAIKEMHGVRTITFKMYAMGPNGRWTWCPESEAVASLAWPRTLMVQPRGSPQWW